MKQLLLLLIFMYYNTNAATIDLKSVFGFLPSDIYYNNYTSWSSLFEK
jgi:hypothetical protein